MEKSVGSARLLILTAVTCVLFILTLLVFRFFPSGLLEEPHVPASEEWRFRWTETAAPDDEASDWRYIIDGRSSIVKPAGAGYLHIKGQLPVIGDDTVLEIRTAHNPVRVVCGDVDYSNHYEDDALWTGNALDHIRLDSSCSGKTLDIYLRAPFAFDFSARLIDLGAPDGMRSMASQMGAVPGYVLILFGLILIVSFFYLSVKNRDMGLLCIAGFMNLTAGALLLLMHFISAYAGQVSPYLYQVQFALLFFLIGITLFGTLRIAERGRFKSMAVSLVPTAFGTALLFGISPAVIRYLLQSFPVVFFLESLLCIVLLAGSVRRGVRGLYKIYFGFLVFTLAVLYGIIGYVYGFVRVNSVLPVLGVLVYLLIATVQQVYRQVFVKLKNNEQREQTKRHSVWLEKIFAVCAKIFAKQDFRSFCTETASGVADLVEEDLEEYAEPEIVSQVAFCAGLRNAGGYETILCRNMREGCDFSKIEQRFESRNGQGLLFGGSYFDMVLAENEANTCIIHVEGIRRGLSDNIKNILQIFYANISVALKNLSLQSDIEQTQRTVFLGLADVAENKSMETGHHVRRVSEYARILAETMGYSGKEVETISQASVMHDIGKLAIPEEIITKHGRLTEDEYNTVKRHVTYGYNILSKGPGEFMKAAASIAREHHERWDGSGYLGLSGEQIHPYARIVALADVLDALLSRRSYKEAWDFESTCKYVASQSGIQFDPAVVDAFQKSIPQLSKIRSLYKD